MYLLGRKCVVADEHSSAPPPREDGFPILFTDLLFAHWRSAHVLKDHILGYAVGNLNDEDIELSPEEFARTCRDIETDSVRATSPYEDRWGYVEMEDLAGLQEWLKQPESGIQKKIILQLSY